MAAVQEEPDGGHKQKIPLLAQRDFFEVGGGFEPPYSVLQTDA